jgi:hypothetical protein
MPCEKSIGTADRASTACGDKASICSARANESTRFTRLENARKQRVSRARTSPRMNAYREASKGQESTRIVSPEIAQNEPSTASAHEPTRIETTILMANRPSIHIPTHKLGPELAKT